MQENIRLLLKNLTDSAENYLKKTSYRTQPSDFSGIPGCMWPINHQSKASVCSESVSAFNQMLYSWNKSPVDYEHCLLPPGVRYYRHRWWFAKLYLSGLWFELLPDQDCPPSNLEAGVHQYPIS